MMFQIAGKCEKWRIRLGLAAFVMGILWGISCLTEAAHAQIPIVHVVQSEEELFRIAERYGMNYQVLARYNGIRNPNHLRVGQRLRIPALMTPAARSMQPSIWPTSTPVVPQPKPTPRIIVHIVRHTETLSMIAPLYDISVAEIKRWNGITRDTMYAGQRLVIFRRE